jgi:hypothetical protein
VGTGANGVWARASDAATALQLGGAITVALTGVVYGGHRWSTSFRSSDTLGTTSMVWTDETDRNLVVRGSALLPNTNYTTTGFTQVLGTPTAFSYDPLVGGMTLVTNGLQVPVGGYYGITFAASFATGTAGSGRKGIGVGVNGAQPVNAQFLQTNANNASGQLMASVNMVLAAGDIIGMWRYTDAANLYASTNGWISAVRITP